MKIDLILLWEKNKEVFRQELVNNFKHYTRYSRIVESLFNICFVDEENNSLFDTSKMVQIDNGEYQGTLIYVIPYDTYQPNIHQHVYTHIYYGSCNLCDMLGIVLNQDNINDQVNGLMSIALQFVQRIKKM